MIGELFLPSLVEPFPCEMLILSLSLDYMTAILISTAPVINRAAVATAVGKDNGPLTPAATIAFVFAARSEKYYIYL